MNIEALFAQYGRDAQHQMQAVFASIFILQNRVQTAGERLQGGVTMKQWLLLAMTAAFPDARTLTELGRLMGCSRQNVKKLAAALEKKGFARLIPGANNSVRLELTDKATEYAQETQLGNMQALQLLFADFSAQELEVLFGLYGKLYAGVARLEEYAEAAEKGR